MALNNLYQNQQPQGGIDQLAQNAMFPQSQMDKTQYATPSQMPTSAEVINSDYDPQTDPYTGMPAKPFAAGGIAYIPRYNGEEDGSVVQAPQDPTFGNKDLTALAANGVDPTILQQLNTLKSTDPGTYNSQLMQQLGTNLVQNYNGNANYDALLNQIQSLKDTAPKDYYNTMANFYGHQMGWQVGQNTSERNAPVQANLQGLLQDAQKAGIDPNQLSAIAAQANQSGNVQNQQRIAQDAANGGGAFGGFGQAMPMFAGIAAMALAPELAPLLAPELGALGGTIASGAITGGAVGGIGALASGRDVGQGVLTGGATGAVGAGVGGALNGIDPNLAQGLNTAKSLYGVSQSNGQNIGADINAFKGIANMAPTMSAAHGGLMSGGGIANLGSYSDGGQLLKGPGDGMSDNIPAKIGQHQPARLADGEFVIPADVVSHLGNGSTDAGAKQLYKMMDRIRRARTGNPKQGKRINPEKFTLKG